GTEKSASTVPTGIFVNQPLDERFIVHTLNSAEKSADGRSITCTDSIPESKITHGMGVSVNVGSALHHEGIQKLSDMNATLSFADSNGSTVSVMLPSPAQVY